MSEDFGKHEPRELTTHLVAAIARGDARAWAIGEKRFDCLIKTCCWNMGLRSADVVDDMTQEVLSKLFLHVKAFVTGPKRPFRPWLKVVVENSIKDYLRKQGRQPGDRGRGGTGSGQELHEVPAPGDSDPVKMAQDLEEQLEKDRLMREAFELVKGRVESRTWQAFWLTAVENWSGREVAKELKMENVATVFVHKSRVQKMIRKEVDGLLNKASSRIRGGPR